MAAPMEHVRIQSQQQPTPTATQLQNEADPINKTRQLIPQLKDSLANLMRVAGQCLQQGTSVDDRGMKMNENPQQKFEKSLEEFYITCDQIETCLRSAVEAHQQNYDNVKYSPFVINIPKDNNQWPEGQTVSYSQFMSIIKLQINSAKEIHNLLLEHAQKLAGVSNIS